LHGDPDRLREHSAPGVWSPLEYACHYRDVLRVQLERVRLAVREDKPKFAPMGREERVTQLRYNEQDPHKVAFEIAEAAGALASALDRLGPLSWEREGYYNYPAPQLRSVEWIGRHTIHEGVHHLLDMERQLEAQSGS
jgi:S-DNA-T family DNA segregation ATPase FtsK/SpoIIIE